MCVCGVIEQCAQYTRLCVCVRSDKAVCTVHEVVCVCGVIEQCAQYTRLCVRSDRAVCTVHEVVCVCEE